MNNFKFTCFKYIRLLLLILDCLILLLVLSTLIDHSEYILNIKHSGDKILFFLGYSYLLFIFPSLILKLLDFLLFRKNIIIIIIYLHGYLFFIISLYIFHSIYFYIYLYVFISTILVVITGFLYSLSQCLQLIFTPPAGL